MIASGLRRGACAGRCSAARSNRDRALTGTCRSKSGLAEAKKAGQTREGRPKKNGNEEVPFPIVTLADTGTEEQSRKVSGTLTDGLIIDSVWACHDSS